MSLKTCIPKLHSLLKDFDLSEIETAAADYQEAGMSQREAELRAIADRLRELRAEKGRIEAIVIEAFRTQDPEGYAEAQNGAGPAGAVGTGAGEAAETEEERLRRMRERMSQQQEERRARVKAVAALFEASGAVEGHYKSNADVQIILSRNTYPGGEKFRVTSFDENGPMGHREYATVEGAADEFNSNVAVRGLDADFVASGTRSGQGEANLETMFDELLAEETQRGQAGGASQGVYEVLRRIPQPDGMEIHVFRNDKGVAAGLYDADAEKYVDQSITIYSGADALQKATAKAEDMVAEGALPPRAGPTVNSEPPRRRPRPARQPAKQPQGAQPRTAAEALGSAAENTAEGLANAIKGLGELFGGGGKLSSGLTFDEQTYERAKPLFIQALRDFKDAAADLREAMRAIIRMVVEQFGANAANNMRPYVVRFMQDVQAGRIELAGEADVPGTGEDSQRDRSDAATQDGMVPPALQQNAGEPDSGSGSAVPGARGQRGPASGRSRVPGNRAAAGGERGDQSFHSEEGRSEPTVNSPRGDNAGGSAGNRGDGPADVVQQQKDARDAAQGVTPRLSLTEKRRLQQSAESVSVIPADPANIAETLPYLLPSQHEDVAFAERRLFKPDGYGVLFTNGTGTGKTYLGLGVIKRMVKQGKGEGLIVVPSQKIIDDWVSSAENLGLTLNRLESTQDAGRGVSITTYANLGENETLADRDYDFVVADEAHSLMQSEAAEVTAALRTLRALALHPDSATQWATLRHRDQYREFTQAMEGLRGLRDDTMDQILIAASERAERASQAWKALEQEAREKFANLAPADRPRALFLSATPFAYEKNVQWAEGFLFEFARGDVRIGNSNQSGFEQFMVQHFGYRIRYHKLTEPGPEVDRDLMQRQFNTWLRSQGVLSARMLDVDADYDRKFVYVDSKVGHLIDDGLKFLSEAEDGRYRALYEVTKDKFKFLERSRLLEALKAREMVPYIRRQLELGRKLVVFYDYNEGGGFSIFKYEEIPDGPDGPVMVTYQRPKKPANLKEALDAAAAGPLPDADAPNPGNLSWPSLMGTEEVTVPFNQLVREFNQKRPDLVALDTIAMSPLRTLKEAFPQAVEYNGTVPPRRRTEFVNQFNNDELPGVNLILAQKAANAGWSAHDTTGRHPRVLINLGLPTAPTVAIQQEGRIYRVGQASDAMFRYVNTGTSWERSAFAEKMARRAGTAENLAMGEDARGLTDSFIQAFEEADIEAPGYEGEGKGGKARDRAFATPMSEFERAKTFYFAQHKRTSKTKSQEGTDYFATPEPLGLKMVHWGQIAAGESVLEPSAGHGAIARWFPALNSRTVIEPSFDLSSRLSLVTDAQLIQTRFEDWHIVNKRDVIVMNPPFGQGGATAIAHIDKAFRHLPNGGRIVALIPTGPAADKRFDAWLYEENKAEKDRTQKDAYLVADYKLPQVTFERAGTKVATRIVIIDKSQDPGAVAAQSSIDWSDVTDIKELFARIENVSGPRRAGETESVRAARAAAEGAQGAQADNPPAAGGESGAVNSAVYHAGEFRHTKTGETVYVAAPARFLGDDFKAHLAKAKSRGGYYNSYGSNGAIKGFAFKSAEVRDAFMADVGGTGTQFSMPESGFRRSTGIPSDAAHIHSFKSDQPLKAHPSYRAAKAGDMRAAARLVADLVPSPEHNFGDAIFVPVRTLEASGFNQIPLALARSYAGSQEVAHDIVQVNRSFHTGADPMERLVARAIFDGPVQAGARYVLVDDVTTMGGTLADLASFIQSKGGIVVGTVVLTNASRAGNFDAQPAHTRLLERRFGNEIRELFGVEPSALTADEAGYLVGFRNADELRNRVAKAKIERGRRILSKPLGQRPPLASQQIPTEARPRAGLSVSEVEKAIGRAVLAIADAIGLKVRVVADQAELPADIQSEIPPGRRPYGLLAPDGTVYLIAANLPNAKAARVALAHEVIGHVGMNAIIPDWKAVRERLSWLVKSGNKRAADIDREVRRRYPDVNADTYAREFIAVSAERRVKDGPLGEILSQIRAAIRRFLTKLGIVQAFPDWEIDVWLSDSANYIRSGRPKPGMGADGVSFSQQEDVPSGPLSKNTMRRLLRKAFQGWEPVEVPRVRASQRLAKLVEQLGNGDIDEVTFANSVRLLTDELETAKRAKRRNRLGRERERGPDLIRERLLAARRRGELDPDTVEFALWALDKNPALAENLGISIRQAPEGEVLAAGDYMALNEIMRVFKGEADGETAVHEILHHAERMMPREMQNRIRRDWARALARAVKAASPEQRAALLNIVPAMSGDTGARRALRQAFLDGVLTPEEHYQLTNPSEFWAVNASRLLWQRFEARDNVYRRILNWLRELVERVKSLLGARADGQLLRALDQLLDRSRNDGEFVSDDILTAMTPELRERVMKGQRLQSYGGAGSSDTVALANRGRAERMIGAGIDPEAVRLATGWFKGPYDGKWRYEFSDAKARMTSAFDGLEQSQIFGEEKTIKLREVLDHPALYKAYPAAGDIDIVKRSGFLDFGGLQGWFDGKNQIGLTPYAQDKLSTLLHEVQHWIQSREGFAAGGNENLVFETLTQDRKEYLAQRAIEKSETDAAELIEAVSIAERGLKLPELAASLEATKAFYEIAEKTEPENAERREKYRILNEAEKAFRNALFGGRGFFDLSPAEQRAAGYFVSSSLKDVEERISTAKRLAADTQAKVAKLRSGDAEALKSALQASGDLYKLYRAIAGEIEARDVQARQSMSEEARRSTKPFSSEDIDPADVIVVFDKAVESASIDRSGGVPRSEELRGRLRSLQLPTTGTVAEMTARLERARSILEEVRQADLDAQTVPWLRERLRALGRRTDWPKEQLVARLRDAANLEESYVSGGRQASAPRWLVTAENEQGDEVQFGPYVTRSQAERTVSSFLGIERETQYTNARIREVSGPQFSMADDASSPSFDATARAYGGREAYERAKAAGRTKLTYGQWVQVRTPEFKAWFGDWEALRSQQRMDSSEAIEVPIPNGWENLSKQELRRRVADALNDAIEKRTSIEHPELGPIRVGRKGERKTISSSADPAKLLIANALDRVIPASIPGEVLPGNRQGIEARENLQARVRVGNANLIAIIAVNRKQDGRWYYNTVAVADAENRNGPDRVKASPGAAASPLGETPLAGAVESFVRQPFRRVNPDTVSKVIDPETGEPLVLYHGTTRGGFAVFDRLKTLEWRSPSMDTIGSWFSDNPSDRDGAGLYASGGGDGDTIYPVYLRIQNPKLYRTFNDFLRHMHRAAGRPFPESAPGRGSTEELRAELMEEGYDGIEFEQTANESLMQDITEMQDAVERAKQEEFSVRRAERLPYTQKRERLEQTLRSMRKELDEFGSSTEFDNQRVFIALEPTQIKSAIGNRGTFEGQDPRIQFMFDDGFDLPSESTFDYLVRNLQDRFRRVKILQRAIREAGGEVTPESDAYLKEEIFHGKVGARIESFMRDRVEPLLKAMQAAGVTLEELDDYLYAKHAPERNARIAEIREDMPDGGSGMTTDEATAYIASLPRERVAKLDALARRVWAINQARVDLLEEAGLESPEQLAEWRAGYQFYVPLRGFSDTELSESMVSRAARRLGRGFDIRGKESQRALGRRSRSDSPLVYSIAQMQESIVRAAKNEVGQAFLRLVEENPNPGLWSVHTGEMGDYKPAWDARRGEVVYRRDRMKKLADNVLSVKRDGKEHFIVLEDQGALLARAFKNLGVDNSNAVVRFLAGYNRYMAAINTSLNPEFVLTNFARDLQTAVINLVGEQDARGMLREPRQMGRKVLKDIPKAMRGAFLGLYNRSPNDPWVRWFNEFRDAGGMINFYSLNDLEGLRAELKRTIDASRAGAPKRVLNALRALGRHMGNTNSAVENAVRLSTYANARRAGFSQDQAASLARNVTVNFTRKGEYGNVANAMYLFYNASLQGSVRLLYAISKSRRVRAILGGLAASALVWGMLNRMLAGDDDEDGENRYDKVPNYIKTRNIIFMRPDGSYWKWPLPYGYNVPWVLGTYAENALAHPEKRMEGAVMLAQVILESFNPLGGLESEDGFKAAAKLASPTIADPWVEMAINEDWAGRPIRRDQPDFGPPLPDNQLYWSSVSPTSKSLTASLNELTGGNDVVPGAIDLNPETLDHLFSALTGGLGRAIGAGIDIPLTKAQGEALKTDQIPFVRRFVGEPSESYTFRRYDEIKDGVQLYSKRHKAMLSDADTRGEARSYREQNRVNRIMEPYVKAAESQLSTLYRQRKAIERSALDEATKKSRLERFDQQLETVRKRVIRRYNEVAAEAAGKPKAQVIDLSKDPRALEIRRDYRDKRISGEEARRRLEALKAG